VRRRARFLRKARELAYRDLGGLVFNLHRFGQRNDALVLNKLNTLGHIDAELRTLETALRERDTVTVLREAGITACPRCAAIHSGDDRFCPNCGLSMSRDAELPIAGAPPPPAPAGPPPAAARPATASAPGPATAPVAQSTASWPAPSQEPAAYATPPPATSAPAAGRAPTPPAGRAPSPPSTEGRDEGSGEGERTEVLHPLEPDK
jgi:hypothetical protein